MTLLPAVEFHNLTKEYVLNWRGRRFRALDRLTWRVESGEIAGLLGPNGCGKSTTLRLLLGLVPASSGRASIFGGRPADPAIRRRVGFLPDANRAFGNLTGRELLRYQARLGGVAAAAREDRLEAVLATVALQAAADRRISTYSAGMAKRIGLAQALVHDPDLLVLDEPTSGLDPRAVHEFGELLNRLKRDGKTVLFTSHLMDQVTDCCDRIALLHQGQLVMSGRLDELLVARDREAMITDALPAHERAALRDWLRERGRTLHRIDPVRVPLEQLFLTYTRDDHA